MRGFAVARVVAVFFAAMMYWAGAKSAEIDLLAVYTSEVERSNNGVDGVVALMQGAVDSANWSFERSGVDLTLRLVGVERTDLVQRDSLSDELELISERDGVADDILDLRNELGADLVCLAREGDDGIADGIAYLLANEGGQKDGGFLVVNSFSLITTHLLEHEIGHTLGAAHDRDNANSPGLYSFSYGHRWETDDIPYRTVMAYDPGVPTGYFSNPDIEYYGVPTGVSPGAAGEADNAETLRRTASTVAGYFPRLPIKPIVSLRDQYLFTDLDGDGRETVRIEPHLVFAGSEPLSWSWIWEGGVSDSRILEGSFALGSTEVTLEVDGGAGMSSTYVITIDVSELSTVAKLVSGNNFSVVLMEDGGLSTLGDPSFLLKGDFSSFSEDLYPIDEDVIFVEAGKADNVSVIAYVKEGGALWGIGWVEDYAIDSNEGSSLGNRLLIESGAAKVALGQYFGLVIMEDGHLWGFGGNAWGQLGPLESFPAGQKFGDTGIRDVVEVAASQDSSVFVKEDGSLWGMGRAFNFNEENYTASSVPVKLIDSGIVNVSAGRQHFMALSEDGSVYVSGLNQNRQLGLEGVDRVEGFQKVDGVVAKGIYCDGETSLITLADDALLMWGHVRSEPLKEYHEYDRIFFRNNVAAASLQGTRVMALRDNGSVWMVDRTVGTDPHSWWKTWHYDTLPEMVLEGRSTGVARPPVAIAGNDVTVESKDLGPYGRVKLDGSASYDDWSVQSWSWSWEGGSSAGKCPTVSLPVGENLIRLVVTDDDGLTDFDELVVRVEKMDTGKIVGVEGDSELRLFRTENGFVAGAGRSIYIVSEEVSQGEYVRLPTLLGDRGSVRDIAVGNWFYLVLRDDGSLWGNGSRSSGQLGPEAGNSYHDGPVELFANGVKQIEAGNSKSLVVMDDGSLWVAGRNEGGVLGAGESEWLDREFVRVIDSGVRLVKTGSHCTLVVMEDGSLWGMGSSMRLGFQTDVWSREYEPVKLPMDDVVDVHCVSYSYVLTSDNSLWRIGNEGFENVEDLIPAFMRKRFSEQMSHGILKMEAAPSNSAWPSSNGPETDLFILFGDHSLWRLRLDSYKWEERLAVVYSGGVVDFSASGFVVREDGTVWGTGYDWNGVEHDSEDWSAELSKGFVEAEYLPEPENLAAVIESERSAPINVWSRLGEIKLNGSFSRSDWKVASWKWNIDGADYAGQNIEVSLEEGIYEIALTVEDWEGNTAQAKGEVTVADPSVFTEWLKLFWSETELAQFGDEIARLDFDNDMLTNHEEWLLRMDPSDFDSRIDFQSRIIDGKLELRVRMLEGIVGLEFQLLVSDDGNAWEMDHSAKTSYEDEWMVWGGLDVGRLYRFRVRNSQSL